jgi:predicted nucleic acid-binding protein
MISIDDALAGVNALAFDTSPFIYFIERHQTYLPVVREIFRRVDSGAIRGASSMITLAEVLTKPKQARNIVLQEEYRDLLLHGNNFRLALLTVEVADRAAELRAKYALRTPDAIQVRRPSRKGAMPS